jgi:hypothetical protein
MVPYTTLHRAMEVVAYDLEIRGGARHAGDAIAALEALRAEAAAFPPAGSNLRDVYPSLVRTAVLALLALGAMPDPDEIDRLAGFEGFGVWRESR